MPPVQLIYILAANGLLSVICIPFYIRAARSNDIVDVPNERSSHNSPTPRGGGIFIAVGALLTVLVVTAFAAPPTVDWALLAGGALVTVTGFVDDLKTLSPRLRLGSHILAAGLLIAGVIFAAPERTDVLSSPLLFVSLAALTIWIVGCLNIYNFMDGIDGIATGQGIAAAITWLAISLFPAGEADNLGTLKTAALAAALLGGLLAFLCFNWSPAKVFMGDGASGFLGFSFAALPILVAVPTPADIWLKLNLGALTLFPFIFDGTFTLFRRARCILIENSSSQSASKASALGVKLVRLSELTEAHRSHLYQRWIQSEASHQKVASAYTAWAVLCGLAAGLVHLGHLNLFAAYAIALAPAGALLRFSRRFPKA
ncbi:hypothetical protein [Pelagicoccus sp. SDUM812002]|uniref:hypothetical protein n=1 Tax=Pelagicoccus sp. SDUM812002 TaxID=3041266 RepID=UPI00280F0B96|nr:hypothetical protein [Pelagicoccus sp. SDUM812002]MDQ8186276.1 hypothetical protein [Pelagicoccus sp. SDUM812002]